MKNFYAALPSGEICMTGICGDFDLELQKFPGGSIYEGTAVVGTSYRSIIGDVNYFPDKPSINHKWNYAMEKWVDPRTLDDLKLAQWELVKQARQIALYAPLETPLGMFDADLTANTNITKSVLLANTLTGLGQLVAIDYTLANNTVITLNAAEMIGVGLALALREQSIRAKATDLRSQIESATTAKQVATIVW